MLNLTEKEKRVVSTLVRHYEMTKKDLARECDLSWGTIVHIVNDFMEKGVIKRTGTSEIGKRQLGKNAYTFALNDEYPLFLGIDVEYSITTVVMVGLKNDILASSKIETPKTNEMRGFVETLVRHVRSEYGEQLESDIHGIGIGVPFWLFPDGPEAFTELSSLVGRDLGVPTCCDNNINAFTRLKQFEHFRAQDFIALSIRDGLGMGVIYNQEFVSGDAAWASQIGHLKLEGNELPCRCGQTGCLETVLNQNKLYEMYVNTGLPGSIGLPGSGYVEADVQTGLSRLFHDAAEGSSECHQIIDYFCSSLADVLAPLVVSTGIPNLLVTGNFGEDGQQFADRLNEQITRRFNRSRGSAPEIVYTPLIREGFARGAALLIMNDAYDVAYI